MSDYQLKRKQLFNVNIKGVTDKYLKTTQNPNPKPKPFFQNKTSEAASMVKYLFSIVTTCVYSKRISNVFTSKMNDKWKHYQKILFKKSIFGILDDAYYFICSNNKCAFYVDKKKYSRDDDHIIGVNIGDDNYYGFWKLLKEPNDFIFVATEYHQWHAKNMWTWSS